MIATAFFIAIIDRLKTMSLKQERIHMKVAAIQMPTVKDKMQNIRTAGTYRKNKGRKSGLCNPSGDVLLSVSD